ncbi:MAG: ABC transporter permease [Ruminococcus flavefaciens]|nr:ABC transporter permease [Ruminococcus flavefaciens]
MNIFNRVTTQSLRKNKTRTIVTIIGIILSTALICAVTTSVSSFIDYATQYFIRTNGSWHGQSDCMNYEDFSKIKDSEKVENYVAIKEIGYAETESQNEYKPYLCIVSAVGDNTDNIIPINITKGEYPDSADEILIPEHLSSDGGIVYNIGDKIELEIGDRITEDYKMHQYNPIYYNVYNSIGSVQEKFTEEEFVPRETRTYTVSGFYERPSFESFYAPGYTAIVLDDGFSEDTVYTTFFTMKNPKDIYDFIEDNNINGSTNYELLMFSGVSRYDSFYKVIRSIVTILIMLIMLGSVSLIYNAFAISVSERTKQFGILSSVGATKKQLRKMVFHEAFILSITGIPAGIIVGITGIGITLSVIGSKISNVISFDIPMKMSISLPAILIACGVSIVTVMISAWIPSIRATRITAVEAIRQSRDIKAKNKPIKTPKIVYKIFGLSGMLAQKYFKRSRKKYRSTIMSLFMSIVLFISSSALCEYLIKSIDTPLGNDYSYDISCDYLYDKIEEDTDETIETLYNAFSSDENITGLSYLTYGNTNGYIETSSLTEEFQSDTGDGMTDSYVQITFVDDKSFRELLKENNLDEEKFMNPDNPLAVTFDGYMQFDYKSQRYSKKYMYNTDEFDFSIELLKNIDGYYFEGYIEENGESLIMYRSQTDDNDVKKFTRSQATDNINLRCGKVLTEKPYWYTYSGAFFGFVYPYSMYEKITQRNLSTHYFTYYMTTDNHSATYENIQKQLDDLSIYAYSYDRIAENEREMNVIVIIRVFAYGFIILISLIAAANVFNTISTNINLRRRDFAMLKSIGMTNKELYRMMNYECIMYGAKSLIYGLPVSAVVTFLIYKSIDIGIESSFFMPWKAVAVAVFSVFAVVFSTMIYSVNKTKADNLIETLKNENL